jgi:hypothetical protein
LLKSVKPIALFLCAVLLFTSLACNLPVGSSSLPEARIPVSEGSAETLEENVAQALENLQNGQPASLTINESELTSLVVYRLEQQSGGMLSQSQVYLRDGLIQYRGQVTQSPVSAPVKIDIRVSAGSDGRLDYDVEQASAGPFGVLQNMIDDFTAQFDQALYSSNSQLNDIFIESVTIADGVMTVNGRPQ